jgi:hypothetical protein
MCTIRTIQVPVKKRNDRRILTGRPFTINNKLNNFNYILIKAKGYKLVQGVKTAIFNNLIHALLYAHITYILKLNEKSNVL